MFSFVGWRGPATVAAPATIINEQIGTTLQQQPPYSPAPAYVISAITDLNPTFYWPLGETSGVIAFDWSGHGNDAAIPQPPNITVGQPGPSANCPAYIWSGTGTSDLAAVQVSVTVPGTTTQVAFFYTTSTAGHIIMQAGNNNTWGGWQAGSWGHTLWVRQTSGVLAYGLYNGSAQIIESTGAVNDGKWHMAAAIRDGTGLYLYLDGGNLVASTTTVTEANGQSGTWWWGIGQGKTGGWPGSGNGIWQGGMAQVAIFNGQALSTTDLNNIYTAVTG